MDCDFVSNCCLRSLGLDSKWFKCSIFNVASNLKRTSASYCIKLRTSVEETINNVCSSQASFLVNVKFVLRK